MANRRHNSSSRINQHQNAAHNQGPRASRKRSAYKGRSRSEISFCVKYAVFTFNVLFWALGFMLLGVGAWSRLEKNNLYSHLSLFYLDPAWILVIVGTVIWSIGFSGCVGALRENTAFLAIYSSILGLLLLTEALVVILAFVAKDFIESDLNNKLDSMIVHYRDDPDLQTIIDWMQMDFQCCGISDPDDWDKNIYFNASAKALKSPEAGGVPYSCCKNLDAALINYACGYQTRVSQADNVGLGEEMARGGRDWLLHLQGPKQSYHSNIYTEGCLPKLQYWLNNNFLYVGAAIFVVAVIQFLGICFAQDLRSDIFAQRSKWSRQT